MGIFSAIGGLAGAAFGMPTVGAGIGGLIDGAKANSAANKSSAQQDAMLQAQARLYNQQADMGQHFFDQYTNNYEPLALSQLHAAQTGVDPNYYAGLADSGVVQNQALALQSAQRNLERNGVAPTDGRWLAMQNQNALQLAGNRVAAQNQARQGALDQNWTRRNQQIDYGAGLLGHGQSMMSGAASGMNGLAGAYGQQAQGAGQVAGYEFGSLANSIYSQYRKPSQDPNYGNQMYGKAANPLSLGNNSNGGFGGF